MGYGDELLGSGMARGARSRGKRIAFGDGHRIIWGPWCAEVFRNNPNVAPPGSEGALDLEWCDFYKGHRKYNRLAPDGSRWIWNMEFRAKPGELYFGPNELLRANATKRGFVLIEPNVPFEKPIAVNKAWRPERMQKVCDILTSEGSRCVQLIHKGSRHVMHGVEHIHTHGFRDACAILSRAALFIGHEGGMHHASAALGIPAVVIFGGCVPPQVTGYPMHYNLTGNSTEACGSLRPCKHCRSALDSIDEKDVVWCSDYVLKSGASDGQASSE